jgi:hypothetical protein
MKVRYMLENPQEVEATMKITMSVKEWETLRDQLAGAWPSSRLYTAITSVLSDARRTIYPPVEKDGFQ